MDGEHKMSCWELEIVSAVVPGFSFGCLLVSPSRYQTGCPLGNCLQASTCRLPSCSWTSGYLPSKGLFLGHAADRHSGPLSDSRASVCLSPCWVSQSLLDMTCGLPCSFLPQKQSLPCCRGWCVLVKGAAQVIFWLLWVGHGGTVGGYFSKACSPSLCLWGWPALLPEVCSQSAAGHWRWCSCCWQCQVLCIECQSGFETWTSLPFCISSWVPSPESLSVLSVSLSVDPAGGRYLPVGCKPVCHISSEYPCLR